MRESSSVAMFIARRGTSMTPLASLCAFGAPRRCSGRWHHQHHHHFPRGLRPTTSRPSINSSPDMVTSRAPRPKKALSRDPNLLLAQALLYAITPGTESIQKVDAAPQAGASLPDAERTELAAWAEEAVRSELTLLRNARRLASAAAVKVPGHDAGAAQCAPQDHPRCIS